ncbi:MAG: PepSY-associated TM helix domain-containing protein [Steroidobacteraceae bacterium]
MNTAVKEDSSRSSHRLYARLWRWHFFAALIVIPFVLWQSITGVLYLWHDDLTAVIYPDKARVAPASDAASLESQLATAMRHQPNGRLASIEIHEDPTRSTAFFFADANGLTFPAFTNPHTGEYLGAVESTHWLRGLTKGLHGGWPINPWGSYLLEIGACWAIVMTLTGLYLWWPRNATGFAGVLYPRLGQGRRIFWRDLHATVGVYFSVILLLFLFSALPWTTFWGNQVLGPIEKVTHQESPLGFFFAAGHHGEHAGHSMPPAPNALALDEIVQRARDAGARGTLEIRPSPTRDLITLRDDHPRAWDEVYMQLNGLTGAVQIRADWNDQPALARLISLGIDLHEGKFFGRANQVFNTLMVVALIWLVVTGFMGWYRRRPNGGVSAPPRREVKFPRSLVATGIVLCVVMPLLGLSVLMIATLDRLFGRVFARPA